MNSRITATEMEYGLLTSFNPGDEMALNESVPAKVINDYSPSNLVLLNGFASNGARYYPDYGHHLEYATPEDDSITGTVANEIAGERIVYQSLENARQDQFIGGFLLNKRLIDDQANSWGHHENYCIDATKTQIAKDQLATLALHLATVNLFTGAGAVARPRVNERRRFVISQKSLDLEADYSLNSTKNKPIVNLRNEPHADHDKWLRLHVTSGDANMSPWAMRMRLGSVSMILRLIESGHRQKMIVGEGQPLARLATVVATDLTLNKKVRLDSGATIRPLEIQGELIQAVQQLATREELPVEERDILMQWEKAYVDMEKDPLLLFDRVDWVARKIFLDTFREKTGLDWSSAGVRQRDRSWDELSPDGVGLRFRKSLWKQWMPTEQLISERMISPPTTTRALIRGSFIRRFAGTQVNGGHRVVVNWDSVERENKSHALRNPYSSRNKAVEMMLADHPSR